VREPLKAEIDREKPRSGVSNVSPARTCRPN